MNERNLVVVRRFGLMALLSSSMLIAIAAPHAAWAMDAAAAADGQGDAATDRPIEAVTVVARKRAENVQSVPIPITVLTPEELKRENLVNFTDFQVKFPAFSVYLTNPKQLNIGVRGIGNNGFNTDGVDGSVGVFIDGVFSGRQGMVSSDFNDIEQVELLRGPQGTLFGKNTTAGAIVINSAKPSFIPGLSAEATLGDENLQQYKVSATGPLIADKLAVRLSAFYSDRKGNYPNLYNGNEENGRQGEGVRLQFLATPTDNLTVRVIASHASQDFNSISPVTLSIYNTAALQARMAAAGYTLNTGTAANRQIDINGSQTSSTRSNLISTQLDYDMGARGTLTSITAFQGWSCYTNNDNDYTQLDAIRDYGSCNTERQFSEEARWATPKGGPIEGVLGTFVSRQTLDVNSRIQFGDQYYIWAANPSTTAFPNLAGGGTWAKGAYANGVDGAGFRSHASFHTDTEAFFGNFTWHPDAAQKWSFDVGARQTWEQKNMSYLGWVDSNPGDLSTSQLKALSPSGANAQLGSAADAVTDVSLSGQAGVSYRFTPSVMAYLNVSRGHKSKGFNLLPENSSNPDSGVASAIAHGAKQDIAGEQADNLEFGLKSEWLNHHLIFNATAFETYVKNYQANESIGVGNTATKFLANVGAMRSEGVELEGEAALLDGLHLKGFVGFDRAIYASFRDSVCPAEVTTLSCDLTGRQVAWAPKWTSDMTVNYTHRIAEDVTGYVVYDENWRSTQNTTITLDPTAQIKSYALASIRVGTLLRNNTVDVQFWVENLFDKAYYINLLGLTKSTGIVQGYPGNPRTFGGTLRLKF